MKIEELNFEVSENKSIKEIVYVGTPIRVFVRNHRLDRVEILEGEIRGAYYGEDNEYCIVIYGNYKNWVNVEPMIHEVYLGYITGYEVL